VIDIVVATVYPRPGGPCDSLAPEAAFQVRRVVTSIGMSCALLLLSGSAPFAAVPAGPPPGAPDRPAGDIAAVHIVIDTLAVDGKGTRLVGTDEADLVPGASGVLEKTITLVGPAGTRRRETVRLKSRVTPLPPASPGSTCSFKVEIEAAPDSAHASGRGKTAPAEAASATLALSPGEERMLEAYSSTRTDGRVVLKLRCEPSAPRTSDDQPSLVTLNVTIERAADAEPEELLRNQVLTAAMTKTALTVAVANQALPDGTAGERRYRRERLEVTMSPILVVAGKLQLEVRVDGDVDTISSSGETIRHPVQAAETFVVGPGEPRQLTFEIPSDGPEEGWSRVRFRVQVASRF
jgi:hypothetical protein